MAMEIAMAAICQEIDIQNKEVNKLLEMYVNNYKSTTIKQLLYEAKQEKKELWSKRDALLKQLAGEYTEFSINEVTSHFCLT